jgi:hypothetical protein
MIEDWRQDYNEHRPHSALGMPPSDSPRHGKPDKTHPTNTTATTDSHNRWTHERGPVIRTGSDPRRSRALPRRSACRVGSYGRRRVLGADRRPYPKPSYIPSNLRASVQPGYSEASCKSAGFSVASGGSENRGVPGSNPGLAMRPESRMNTGFTRTGRAPRIERQTPRFRGPSTFRFLLPAEAPVLLHRKRAIRVPQRREGPFTPPERAAARRGSRWPGSHRPGARADRSSRRARA